MILFENFFEKIFKNMSYLCDVHVQHIRRCGYSNLEDWINNPNNVYIGRKGILIINSRRFPEKDSIWANPYKVGKDGDLQEVLNKYYEYIAKKIVDENLFDELKGLKGKYLGCWCVGNSIVNNQSPPWICHGQILLYLVNYFYPI